MRTNLIRIAIGIWFVAPLHVAHAERMTYQTIPLAINNLGQVVGFASLASGEGGVLENYGFLYADGAFAALELPGSRSAFAYGINDAGRIILNDNQGSSFVYEAGRVTEFSVPGSTWTWAHGINNAGNIVGSFGDGVHAHGYLDIAGEVTLIDVPGSIQTDPFDINNRGQIVGRFFTSPSPGNVVEHGFLYTGGVFSTIDVPDTELTELAGINDTGQIVGFSSATENGVYSGHSFLYSDGLFTRLQLPDGSDFQATGINNLGQIVGAVQWRTGVLYKDGVFTTVVAPESVFNPYPSSTPEPCSLMVVAGGLAALMVLRRASVRRRLTFGRRLY